VATSSKARRDGRSIDAFAPAKLNLFLHVVGRRSDGYHLLESLMVLLGFGDRMRFTLRDDDAILRVQGNERIPADDDLCIRAARMLALRTGCRRGVAIAIDKRIPLGGGLGGGSSNAATTLLALNRLWGLGLSRERLCAVAAELGSDVPFFVFGESAWATGVGEKLRAMSVPPAWFVVLMPAAEVPTARIFASPKLTRDSESAKIPLFPDGHGRNDLQAVATDTFPEIGECLAALRQYDPRMTGSGACVFAAFRSEAAARQALAGLPAGLRGFVARSLPRHPMFGFAASVR
jgi:4-diphosphocytidyl-2-C-methyl-D-erythritol kinase